MAENNSDRNGRALEYILCVELDKLPNYNLTPQAQRLNARDKDKFLSLPHNLQTDYISATPSICNWINNYFSNTNNASVDRLNDTPDDPSDVIITDANKKLSISLKHNHEALKHPRPYSFAQACGYQKGTNEDLYYRNFMTSATNNFRTMIKNKTRFNQCPSTAIDKLYLDVCLACKQSIDFWKTTDNNLPSHLFKFLVGNGFYKVIVETTKNCVNVKAQDFLTIPIPTSVNTKVNANRLILEFNNGWILNLRIHTASSEISTAPNQLSLKFDAQKDVGLINEFNI
tara:strand:+ start:203 stop:1060 length:858 start_codon:yes stop_codon:yes gene_type:complete